MIPLHEAFGIEKGDRIAFVGAGGKTSLLTALALSTAGLGWRVLATTTTRVAIEELAPFTSQKSDPAAFEFLPGNRLPTFLYKQIDEQSGKVIGVDPAVIDHIAEQNAADLLLVEADGARQRLFKLPRDHEPVIPASSTLVIPIVSLDVLGRALTEEDVFNSAALAERYRVPYGTRVRARLITAVLSDALGGLKGIPPNARVIPFLNAAPDVGYRLGQARFIACQLLKHDRIDRVVIGNTGSDQIVKRVEQRVGAVVLAAGLSTRMGSPKPLLAWNDGSTILDHILTQLRAAQIDPIVVVTGNRAEAVSAIAADHGVAVVHNPDYASGEMLSSLQAGLRAMPGMTSAALVVLGDQPTLRASIVKQVVRAFKLGRGKIVAPSFKMRRGHPILIGREYWGEILALGEGGAPRDVINRHSHSVAYINVDDEGVLRDVDTPQQYQEERRRAGLSATSID